MKWGKTRIIGVFLLVVLVIVAGYIFFNKGNLIQFNDPVVGSTGGGTTPPINPPPALVSSPENTYSSCDDGIDNDGDGYIDCSDTDCSTVVKSNHALVCIPGEGCEDKDEDGFYVEIVSNEIETSGIAIYCGPYLDCDDGNAAKSPDTANEERTTALCTDGVDNDCNNARDVCLDFDSSNNVISDPSCRDLYYGWEQTCCFTNGAGVLVSINENNCGVCGKVCCSANGQGTYSNQIVADSCGHNGNSYNHVCRGEFVSTGLTSDMAAYRYNLYAGCSAGVGSCTPILSGQTVPQSCSRSY